MAKFGNKFQKAFNAFLGREPTYNIGPSYSSNPSMVKLTRGNERSIINSIYNRIGVDAATIQIFHCKLDKNKRFLEEVNSELNKCFTLSANIDQTGFDFVLDAVISLLDEGVIAIVPILGDIDKMSGKFIDISNLRVGKVVEWYPKSVKVRIYNENTSLFEEKIFSKDIVAIVQNPFYSVMNGNNSTMQRLIRKLNLSDIIDEHTGSQKLDMIIQLPYQIRNPIKKEQADERLKSIEMQMSTSKLGIAYIDSTEHVTQLNRSVENNLINSIEYLTNLLFSQLGLTVEIMNGTADDKVMTNYFNRTVEPILTAICLEMKRKFIDASVDADGGSQSIEFFRDPFKLIPVSEIAEISDKMTRNEIMTSNEVRQVIGMKPADDPRADELRNKNLSEAKGEEHTNIDGEDITDGYLEPKKTIT